MPEHATTSFQSPRAVTAAAATSQQSSPRKAQFLNVRPKSTPNVSPRKTSPNSKRAKGLDMSKSNGRDDAFLKSIHPWMNEGQDAADAPYYDKDFNQTDRNLPEITIHEEWGPREKQRIETKVWLKTEELILEERSQKNSLLGQAGQSKLDKWKRLSLAGKKRLLRSEEEEKRWLSYLQISDPDARAALEVHGAVTGAEFSTATNREQHKVHNKQMPVPFGEWKPITVNIPYYVPPDDKQRNNKRVVDMERTSGRKQELPPDTVNLDYTNENSLKMREEQLRGKRLNEGYVKMQPMSKRKPLFQPTKVYPWLQNDQTQNARQFNLAGTTEHMNFSAVEANKARVDIPRTTGRSEGRFGSPYKKSRKQTIFYDKNYNQIDKRVAKDFDLMFDVGRETDVSFSKGEFNLKSYSEGIDALLHRIDADVKDTGKPDDDHESKGLHMSMESYFNGRRASNNGGGGGSGSQKPAKREHTRPTPSRLRKFAPQDLSAPPHLRKLSPLKKVAKDDFQPLWRRQPYDPSSSDGTLRQLFDDRTKLPSTAPPLDTSNNTSTSVM